MRFRTRSRVFEAVQFVADEAIETMDELFELGVQARFCPSGCAIHRRGLPDHLVIRVPVEQHSSGIVIIQENEWIRVDPGPKVSSITPGLFRHMYEPVGHDLVG